MELFFPQIFVHALDIWSKLLCSLQPNLVHYQCQNLE